MIDPAQLEGLAVLPHEDMPLQLIEFAEPEPEWSRMVKLNRAPWVRRHSPADHEVFGRHLRWRQGRPLGPGLTQKQERASHAPSWQRATLASLEQQRNLSSRASPASASRGDPGVGHLQCLAARQKEQPEAAKGKISRGPLPLPCPAGSQDFYYDVMLSQAWKEPVYPGSYDAAYSREWRARGRWGCSSRTIPTSAMRCTAGTAGMTGGSRPTVGGIRIQPERSNPPPDLTD